MSALRFLATRPAVFAALVVMVTLTAWSRSMLATVGGELYANLTVANAILALMVFAGLWLFDFDEPHDYDDWRRMRWFTYATMVFTAWIWWDTVHDPVAPAWQPYAILFIFALTTWGAAGRSVPKPGERLRGEPRREAFLVLTLDLTQDPPVALRAAVYSCKASQLTSVGLRELNVDIESCGGDSYDEARREMLRQVPTYFPMLVPLLQRSGDLPKEP